MSPGQATKAFFGRAIECGTYDSVAFRFLADNEHPDHDTIAAFRKRFQTQIESLFVEVLKLACTIGMLKLGTVGLDGTKVHANASRHSALSYGHAKKIEKQLKKQVQQLRRLAERADEADIPDRMSISLEVERRKLRLTAFAEVKRTIEAHAEERLERDQVDHHAQLAALAKQEKLSDRKSRERPPEPPTGGVRESDQINLTDEDSRITEVAGGGFDQCYNAQVVVAAVSLLVVANAITQAGNDKQQLVPMIEKLKALPKELGRIQRMLADNGNFSEANVERCATGKIEALIALGRTRHHVSWRQRFATTPRSPPDSASAMHRDGVPVEDSRVWKALRAAQSDPAAGVRRHQTRRGVSSNYVAGA